ncbi:hypothetical protein SKAU_G00286620 [Synaphobranchus kaupii]|uniref:Uncharacterized protein n=1 Tax=Synaphobranchus kaupii TaxID=118154 RepID=A0A9Q1IP89_SYNKA|nr:hypothetical protein SKAU_G00286620 [Synaphobranchus kaupii]
MKQRVRKRERTGQGREAGSAAGIVPGIDRNCAERPSLTVRRQTRAQRCPGRATRGAARRRHSDLCHLSVGYHAEGDSRTLGRPEGRHVSIVAWQCQSERLRNHSGHGRHCNIFSILGVTESGLILNPIATDRPLKQMDPAPENHSESATLRRRTCSKGPLSENVRETVQTERARSLLSPPNYGTHAALRLDIPQRNFALARPLPRPSHPRRAALILSEI